MPDMSTFRFGFWQPIWCYKPTTKFPAPNLMPGRFFWVALDHGDSFTYNLWNNPGLKCNQGQELVRNAVKAPEADDNKPKLDTEIYSRF